MINRKLFFDSVRKDFGKLTVSQVQGFEVVIDQWEEEKYTDLRHLGYMFATDWHETARTMQAIREYGRGKGRPYGRPHPKTGHIYYGRGKVQLTWYDNYLKMGKILGIDLVNNPDKALDLKVATLIMFEGMLTRKSFKGDFTGKSLENYFNNKISDPIGARRIINGTDKARLIAGHYYKFYAGLLKASA